MNRTVAIKIMLGGSDNPPDFQARFEREARTVAALSHPNIIEIYDSGHSEEINYMVMEYIDGGNLLDYIRENQRLDLGETVSIVNDLAAALDYAHALGIIHRDIKPANVLLQPLTGTPADNRGYRSILMDFGIAKMVGGVTALTRTGMIGTLDYISPEQIQDAKEVDGRTDIYSLGVMTFQMLAGELPFSGSNTGAVLIAHLQQPPPDLLAIRSDIPQEMADAVIKAMAKQPEDRYVKASGFASDLAVTFG